MMMETLKPWVGQIRKTYERRQQIQEDVLKNVRENIKTTTAQVGAKAKIFFKENHNHPIVTDYVLPFIESEKTDKALELLDKKVGAHMLVTQIQKLRQGIVDFKADLAKPAEIAADSEAEEEHDEHVADAMNAHSAPKAKKTRSTKKH